MADAQAHKGAGYDQIVACGLPIKCASLVFLESHPARTLHVRSSS